MSNTPALAEREETNIVPANGSSLMDVISRAASDTATDVDKLERLLSMYERITAREAEQAYSSAMNAAQDEMLPISQDAKNTQTKSKYATYSALDHASRPVYAKHGFSLSFDTGDGPENHVRVVCKVSHKAGHSERPHIDIPADGKGAKGGDVMTKTHATMSAVQYGRRALLKMIFNLAENADDDGNAAGAEQFVSEEQVATLRRLIIEVDADIPKLLTFLRVERLEALYASNFDRVVSVIEQKRAREQASDS